ncbi:hypothetical protein DRN94_000800 [archaeon]|nr:hypothetical protein [archaeon]
MNVDVSDLVAEKGEALEKLVEFLEERLGSEVRLDGDTLVVEAEITKTDLRLLLKKFLYKERLKGDFRVISIPEGLRVKRRKKYEETG